MTLAPRASAWRLNPVFDAGAARLCGLIVLLAFYGLTTILYATTRLVQAPFALTIAVALPSSLHLASLFPSFAHRLEAKIRQQRLARLFRAVRALVWAIVGAIAACALSALRQELPLLWCRILAQPFR